MRCIALTNSNNRHSKMKEFYNFRLRVLQSLSILAFTLLATASFGQVTVKATCDSVTTDYTYNIKIEGISETGDYIITVNDTAVFNNAPAGASGGLGGLLGSITGLITDINSVIDPSDNTTLILPIERAFVDGTASINVEVVEVSGTGVPVVDPFVYNTIADEIVHEALCVDADNDGDFDFNEASCDYTQPGPDFGTLISTVAPYNGENVYLYVLTDSAGLVPAGKPSSTSGHFTGLENGTYKVYAYNFLDVNSANAFLNDSLSVGDDMDTYVTGGSSDICFNFCGDATYTIDCACPIQIDTEPIDLALCEDGDGEMSIAVSVSYDGAVSGLENTDTTYQWQLSTDKGVSYTDFADTDSILNLTAVTAAMDSNYYRAIVTFNVNGTAICSDTSSAALLEIFPEPEMATDLDAIVCSDEASGIILAASGATIDSFILVSIDSAGLTPGAGNAIVGTTAQTDYIAADTWTNTTASPVDVTYQVAPLSGNDCIGDTISILLTVNPEPAYQDSIYAAVCSGDMISITIPTAANVTMDSFIVAVDASGLTAETSTSGNTTDVNFIASDVYDNLTGSTDTVTYTITPFADDCEGAAFTIKVPISPEPVFEDLAAVTVCSDTEVVVTVPLTDDNSLAIDSFDIVASVGTTLAGTATEGTGMTTTDTLSGDIFTNTGLGTDSVVYTVTPYVAGCMGEDFTITVRVTPEPLGADSTLIVCSDEALDINLADLVSNMDSLDWTWYATANDSITGETTTASSASSITDVLTNVTAGDEDVIYYAIPSAKDGSCIGDTITITVTVQPEPVYEDDTYTQCSDVALDLALGDYAAANSVAATGYTYTVSSSDETNVPAGTARTDTTAANITDTYTNTTASTVDITYTVTPYSANGCPGDEFTIIVTIDPEPVLDETITATVCSESAIGISLTAAAGTVAIDSFDIVSINSNGLTAASSNISTGITTVDSVSSDVFTNTGEGRDSVIYQIAPITGGCIGDTVAITVYVDPEVTVEAGLATTLCSTADVILADLEASIEGGSSTGTWSTSGTGTFTGGTSFDGATAYVPSAADKMNGGVTLTLTSGDPEGECGQEFDTVEITIQSVECSTFPWTGNE